LSSPAPSPPSALSPPDLILASASPRRRELLERVGLRLTVLPTEIDESVRAGEAAADYVRRISVEKAAAAVAALAQQPELLATTAVLAADTTVIVDGRAIGKPADEAEARAMLATLAGRRHDVTTAYRIVFGKREADRAVTTAVAFRLLDPRELDAYVAGGEWRGKAGGYAVQGVAAAFVTDLRGSPTNVIGLPLAEVLADLRALGALPRYPGERFAPCA
jgi:septum formation protein